MNLLLVRAVSRYAVAGFVVDVDTTTVTESAPILRRWVRKDDARLTWRLLAQNGWKLEALS